jgi:hypothetical protein
MTETNVLVTGAMRGDSRASGGDLNASHQAAPAIEGADALGLSSRTALSLFVLHGFATFLGAALLFSAEPMAAKVLLPRFGGSAGVWTVSLVFYQTLLLAGYAYAHLLVRHLSPRRAALVHAGVTAAAVLFLPWNRPPAAGPSRLAELAPSLGVLGALGTSVGLPFVVLSATAPLLQRWFVASHPTCRPYALYAISNVSSLAARGLTQGRI